MALKLEDIKHLTKEQMQKISAFDLLQHGQLAPAEKEKAEASVGSVLGQLALSTFNSALLDLPKFVLDREEKGLFKKPDTGIEGAASMLGNLLGFVVGAPGKVLLKGAQIGGKLALKAGLKGATKAGKLAVGAAKGAGAFGALEAATLPTGEQTVFDKALAIPTAAGIGAAFGVAEPLIMKALGPTFKKINSAIVNRNGRQYDDALSSLVGESVRAVKNVDKAFMKSLDSKKFSAANEFINNVYGGAKRNIARTRLQIANTKALRDKPDFQALLLDGDVAKTAEAQVKNILGANRNITKESIQNIKNVSKKIVQNRFVSSTRFRLNKQGGSSKEFGKTVDRVRSDYEIAAGDKLVKSELILNGLNKQEKANLVEILDGHVSMPMNKKVGDAAKELNSSIFQDTAKRYIATGGKVTNPRKGILREMKVRDTHFPHMVPPAEASDHAVTPLIKDAFKKGRLRSEEEGWAIWKSYKNMAANKSVKGSNAFANYLIRTNQATKENVFRVMKNFTKKTNSPKFGNLERARDINFPIYDIDADRVLARYIMGSEQRLAEIKHFGIGDEKLKALVDGVAKEGQDVVLAEELMNRITGASHGQNIFGGLFTPQQSSAIRSYQVISKLGLASIPNATQSLNTAMATDLKATSKELAKYLTSGKSRAVMQQQAKQGGVALESALAEYMSGIGLDGSFTIGGVRFSATKFLKLTGFQWLENMNRVVGYHAGQSYAANLGKQLVDNPKNRLARSALKRMGISTKKVLEKNGLDGDDMMRAGRYISDKSQFRAGPLDLPLWMSSPEGKMFSQFKTFGFNQAKFIKDSLKEEVARGNYKPLALAIVAMPALGEGVKNLRAVISGQERGEEGVERLIENISAVGGAGLINDLWNSARYNNIEGAMLGPTGSDVSQLIEGTQRATKGRPQTLQRLALRSVPIIGPRLQNTFVPSNRLKRLREKRKQAREKARASAKGK